MAKKEEQPMITITIRITTEQFALIKDLNINLGEWVRQKLNEDFLDIKGVDKEIERKTSELEELKKKQKILLIKQEESKNISKEELEWLIETKKVIDRNPLFLEGRLRKYLNDFKKPYNLAKAEFLNLLNKAEEKSRENQILEDVE